MNFNAPSSPSRRPSFGLVALLHGAFFLAACGGGGGGGDSTATDTDPTTTDPTATQGGTGSESGGTDTDGSEAIVPLPGGVRRILHREYQRSVELMLGVEAGVVATPLADEPQEGFDAVGAAILSPTPDVVETYERVATAVADAVVANPSTLAATVPCVTGSQNAACFEDVARTLGHWAFRRPPTDEEIARLAGIGAEGQIWADDNAFTSGLKYELMAILQSPSFLYIREVGEDDPETDYRRLTGSELATRLSFFLLGRNPSLELLELAETGGLETSDEIRELASDMVASPEARIGMRAFFDELLRLRELSTTAKSAEVFPLFSPELGESMRQETLLLVHDIIWEKNADYRTLFSANYTFVNDPLAEVYGITPPGTGDGFQEVEWPAGQNRAGYTSQASFLTWQSGPLRNSPSKRGKYVQETVLCNEIPPPDPDAELDLPEPAPNQTLKELLEQHMENEGCKNCHANFDPIGFAFEFYDAIGAYRTQDNGSDIEADGEIGGIGSWDNAKDLGEVLANDPRTSKCLIENLLRGGLGQSPNQAIDPGIDALDLKFSDEGFRVKALLVDMAASPLFRMVDEPK